MWRVKTSWVILKVGVCWTQWFIAHLHYLLFTLSPLKSGGAKVFLREQAAAAEYSWAQTVGTLSIHFSYHGIAHSPKKSMDVYTFLGEKCVQSNLVTVWSPNLNIMWMWSIYTYRKTQEKYIFCLLFFIEVSVSVHTQTVNMYSVNQFYRSGYPYLDMRKLLLNLCGFIYRLS